MIFRRTILIICIVAMLPTTVDPSCVGYFVYSHLGEFASSTDVGDERSMAETDRPAEGLAATRIPSQVSIEPFSALDLLSYLPAPVSGAEMRHPRHTPDFLAPTLRSTFLRNAVLLI